MTRAAEVPASAEGHGERVALVTGGNRGIGLEVCRQLSRRGYRVVVGARDCGRAGEAARALDGGATGETIGVPLDVSDDESVRTAFEQAAKRYGSVARGGLLVNAASSGDTRTDLSLMPSARSTRAPTPWVWLATLPDDGPTGGFSSERAALEWWQSS